jgi:hypothetical protein
VRSLIPTIVNFFIEAYNSQEKIHRSFSEMQTNVVIVKFVTGVAATYGNALLISLQQSANKYSEKR